MDKPSVIELLDKNVSRVIEQYHALQKLKEEQEETITTLKEEIKKKNETIEELTEANSLKELEIEDIISKVQSILPS
jgi:predicted CopG family antitoxin